MVSRVQVNRSVLIAQILVYGRTLLRRGIRGPSPMPRWNVFEFVHLTVCAMPLAGLRRYLRQVPNHA